MHDILMDNYYFWREYKMEDRKIKQTYWLWLILVIIWLAIQWHCNYLAQKYMCEVADLMLNVPFYWISVLASVIEILLSIIILRRATIKHHLIPQEWTFFSFSAETEKTNGAKKKTKVKISCDEIWAFEQFLAIVSIFIFGHSLMIDMIKFFF